MNRDPADDADLSSDQSRYIQAVQTLARLADRLAGAPVTEAAEAALAKLSQRAQ
jgi:hypothetical protein